MALFILIFMFFDVLNFLAHIYIVEEIVPTTIRIIL